MTAYLSCLFEYAFVYNTIGAFSQLLEEFVSVVGWFSLRVCISAAPLARHAVLRQLRVHVAHAVNHLKNY